MTLVKSDAGFRALVPICIVALLAMAFAIPRTAFVVSVGSLLVLAVVPGWANGNGEVRLALILTAIVYAVPPHRLEVGLAIGALTAGSVHVARQRPRIVPSDPVLGLVGAVVLGTVSVGVLHVWRSITSPMIAAIPPPVVFGRSIGVPAAVLGTAFVNAVSEEILWRHFVQRHLLTTLGSVWIAVVVQGVAFGAAHATGIPGGAVGMVLSAAFGIAAGWLTNRTGTIVPAVVAHAIADVYILNLVFRDFWI